MKTTSYLLLSVLFVVCYVRAENFTLNGRVVPNPEIYKYHYKPNEDEIIIREYVLMETHSRSALLCPKDYSIKDLSMMLIVGNNSNSILKNKEWAEHPQIITNRDEKKEVACPTLNRCISFQACLFAFGIEFCNRDPAPGIRKILNVNITCQKSWNGNEVIFLHYVKPYEHQIDLSDIEIEERIQDATSVFNVECPSRKKAIRMNYGGYCNKEPPSPTLISEYLWKVLGRVENEDCREKIKQVYCAYQYNRQGACVPPFYLQNMKFGKIMFNNLSLPSHQILHDSSKLKELSTNENRDLIPARLAFLILVHEDVDAVMQLLILIYRPYFFYVVHVDSNSEHTRKRLVEEIKKAFSDSFNICVLPKERSFRTSWASYEIVRAQLECFEELLRRGLWDFAINLSGADLPLRDVDDLAAALADYRGYNFFSHAVPRNAKPNHPYYKEALFACNGYVYSVTSTDGQPKFDELQIYSSSQWAVFHRDFVEYVVNEKVRTMVFNKYQFLLQTTIVPDESYLITALMNSPLSYTLRKVQVHYYKTYSKVDQKNLCRHDNQDSDFCGQGPAHFEMNDMEELIYSISHRVFFARKFQSIQHPTRNAIMSLIQGGYYSSIVRFLPSSIIKKLASYAMTQLQEENYAYKNYKFVDIANFQIFPRLYPDNPCCYIPFQNGIKKFLDYSYWIDFEIDSTRDQMKRVRALVKPKFNGFQCFGEGHLRMAFATTWTRTVSNGEKWGLDYSLPLPYFPVETKYIWLVLVFHGNAANTQCEAKRNSQPIIFRDLDLKQVKAQPLNIMTRIAYENGPSLCEQSHIIEWNNVSLLNNNNDDDDDDIPSDLFIHSLKLECEQLHPGKWDVEIFAV
ncbi:uncharacterized protein [Centruroides vittatus]|uniref:uncharacterized protein n=1 Tax=Centruroides vittatus TaxID=120091 RepID=UPI00351007CB